MLPGWLVSQSGSLSRLRDALHADGILGWTVRQIWCQGRAGMVALVAAAPAGRHGYRVIDLPADQAWDLLDPVTPERATSGCDALVTGRMVLA